jgi:hypothetical protein
MGGNVTTNRDKDGNLIYKIEPITKSTTLAVAGGFFTPAFEARAIRVDVGGAVQIEFHDGTTDVWIMEPNRWEGCEFKRIVAAGTTATGLHAGR